MEDCVSETIPQTILGYFRLMCILLAPRRLMFSHSRLCFLVLLQAEYFVGNSLWADKMVDQQRMCTSCWGHTVFLSDGWKEGEVDNGPGP